MKKVLSVLSSVFIALLLIFSITMTIMVILGVHSEIGIPTIFGHAIMSVQTDSMEGPDGFYVGDLILVKIVTEEDQENLKVGDVITFWRYIGTDRYLETHRIVEDNYETEYKSEVVDGVRIHGGVKYFVTRGDNTPGVDIIPETGDLEYQTPNSVLAVWTGTAIPKIGGAFDFLKSQTGFMICIVVPVLLFFVYQLYVFIMTLSRKQKEKALEEVSSKEEELKKKAIAEFLAQQQAQQGGAESAPPAEPSSSDPPPAEPATESASAETPAEPAVESASAVTAEDSKSKKKGKNKKKSKNAEEDKEETKEEPKEEAKEETEEEPKEEPKEETEEEPKEETEEEPKEETKEDAKEETKEETEEEAKEDSKEESKPAEPEISEEEKNRIIQEYLAKQAQEKKE